MTKLTLSAFLAPALLFVSSVSQSATIDWNQAWIQPTTPAACTQVCANVRARAVTSGVTPNGQAYAICRANQGGQGKRGGYNAAPDWTTACYVGWDGQEIAATPYECLCQK